MSTQIVTDAVRGVEIIVPLNKLKKSPNNARRMPHGDAAIEALAASIAVKGMLQPPVVEPERDGEGAETGFYLVTAGEGRRLALLLRAKRKQIRKTEPVRCTLDTVNDPHEISLDENVTRTPMHPADQFEAFRKQADERGFGAEEIGARFGVSAHVVKQRLRLGAVSPRLLDIYREDGLTLDQLMAFALTEDHARQEQVFDNLHHNREPWIIRRDLTAANVPGHDRRALFVGAEAYEDAGGVIIRDLFSDDRGGYYEDAGLLDRLAAEHLREIASGIMEAEGWKWAEASVDHPHGHGFRRVWAQPVALSEEDAARLDAASAEHDALAEARDSYDDLPEDVAEKLTMLEAEIDALGARRSAFDPDDVARGGVIVSLGHDGTPRIERGFIRPDDEKPQVADLDDRWEADAEREPGEEAADREQGGRDAEDEAEATQPISDLLLRDLSAYRTMGLRVALGERSDLALAAVVHALAAQAFYAYAGAPSCLELRATVTPLGSHAEGIEDGVAAAALEARHSVWGERLPAEIDGLWLFVVALAQDEQLALLAHCASVTANALVLPWDRKPKALGHADVLATALALDMRRYWQPTASGYFGRVTKPLIVAAIREGAPEADAERIAGTKKAEMAAAAEQLLRESGWLPPQLRTRTAEPEGEVYGPPAPAGADDDNSEALAIAAE